MNLNETGEDNVEIRDGPLIQNNYTPLQSLVDFVYPSLLQNMMNPNFFL